MTHPVILQVPDHLYRALIEKATKQGKAIEDVAIERLSDDWPDDVVDPLDQYVGAFSSGIGDVAVNHDKYLGENLLGELRGENV